MKHFRTIRNTLVVALGGLLAFPASAYAITIDLGTGWDIGKFLLTGGPLGWIGGKIIGFFTGGVADLLGNIAAGIVRGLAAAITAIISLITYVFFSIGSWLVGIAIDINSSISGSETVKLGYELTSNVANMFLVVGIIVIAFMVMFRRAEAKSLLLRFIVAAILINFGFYIITTVFIKPVDEITIALNEASNFEPTTFLGIFFPQGLDWGDVISGSVEEAGWAGDIAISIGGAVFAATFAVLGTITLFAFAAMLFVRYIALGLLIIIFPIAWVFWIFKGVSIPGGNPWSLWSENFARWLLFAPIGMFFFYLSVRVLDSGDLVSISGAPDEPRNLAIQSIANMIIVAGLLAGGLVVANKMSITGAGYAMGVARKAGGSVRGAAANKARLEYAKTKVRLGNSKLLKKRIENATSFGTKSEFAQRKYAGLLARVPAGAVRAPARGLMGATQRGEGHVFEQIKKKYEGYAPYRLAALLDQKNLPRQDRMAIQEIMREKHKNFWETNIGAEAGMMYEGGEFEKYGGQKLQIGMIKEGIDPRVIAGIKRGEKGETPEALGALIRMRRDKLSEKDILSTGIALYAPYDPNTNHYKFSDDKEEAEKIHDKLGAGLIDYEVRYRPTIAARQRNRQTTEGQANYDKAIHKRLKEYEDILSQDKDTQLRMLSGEWEAIKQREIGDSHKAIDAIKDEKITEEKREGEKRRIERYYDDLGPEGYLKGLRALKNSQRDMLGLMFREPIENDTTE